LSSLATVSFIKRTLVHVAVTNISIVDTKWGDFAKFNMKMMPLETIQRQCFSTRNMEIVRTLEMGAHAMWWQLFVKH